LMDSNQVLTVAEVAEELRCSKAHVCNIINGKVVGVLRLPVICLGRRRLVRRETLEEWKKANEMRQLDGNIGPSPEEESVRRMKGDFHA